MRRGRQTLACGSQQPAVSTLSEPASAAQPTFENVSENAVEALEAFGRVDVLMLDFYLPPVTGLEVLRQVNDAARAGRIERGRDIFWGCRA